MRGSAVVVEAHPRVAEVLSRQHGDSLREVGRLHGSDVVVRPRDDFHSEQFDIKGGRGNEPDEET
jgi:Ribonuclease G/E